MKIVLLFSVFVFIVNGQTLDKGQNKRDLILKALSNIRKKSMLLPGQMTERSEIQPPRYGLGEKLKPIPNLLDKMANNLEQISELVFVTFSTEKENNLDGQGDDLRTEIDILFDKIKNLRDVLSNAFILKPSLIDLSVKLYNKIGETFYNSFMDTVDLNVFDDDDLPLAEDFGTSGAEFAILSQGEQLSLLAKEMKEAAKKIRQLVIDGEKSYNLVNAMLEGTRDFPWYMPATAIFLKDVLIELSSEIGGKLKDFKYSFVRDDSVYDDVKIPATNFGTAGGDNTWLDPDVQLTLMAEDVKEFAVMIRILVTDQEKSNTLVQNIGKGLDSIPSISTREY